MWGTAVEAPLVPPKWQETWANLTNESSNANGYLCWFLPLYLPGPGAVRAAFAVLLALAEDWLIRWCPLPQLVSVAKCAQQDVSGLLLAVRGDMLPSQLSQSPGMDHSIERQVFGTASAPLSSV